VCVWTVQVKVMLRKVLGQMTLWTGQVSLCQQSHFKGP